MEYLVLGFFTGLSLILAIGAQNIFVIEQGLKKQYTFLVCLVCSLSDLLLIFSGILLFHFFHQYLNLFVELVLNILLIIFLIYNVKVWGLPLVAVAMLVTIYTFATVMIWYFYGADDINKFLIKFLIFREPPNTSNILFPSALKLLIS